MAASATLPISRHRSLALRLAPTLVDLVAPAILLVWFSRPSVWQAILADGDTGWHIRTGDLILHTHSVPVADPFSFSRPGAPWYAWEWLSDVIFARLHLWHGLEAVAALTVVIICLWVAGLFCWLLRRGAGLWISAAVTLAVLSASSVHFLARPHIFSLLFLLPALWLLDQDRRAPSPRVWWLVPMTALWANLHAGFIGWIAILVIAATPDVAHALVRAASTLVSTPGPKLWSRLRRLCVAANIRATCPKLRYALLATLCALATLANPYGWNLHRHIVAYLTSSWILTHIQEFQASPFRAENALVFAALLFAGIAAAVRRWTPGQWFECVLILVWGFAALRSARHIPWFSMVAAPIIASAAADGWSRHAARSSPRSAVKIFWDVGVELASRAYPTAWLPVFGALALWIALPGAAVAAFPSARFPVDAVSRNLTTLTAGVPRILAPDQWSDYLIYRFAPAGKVFFDGRSDFYGPAIGDDYQSLLIADQHWPEVMARYGFQLALLPLDWPLVRLLEREPGWRVLYRDRQAVLLAKEAAR